MLSAMLDQALLTTMICVRLSCTVWHLGKHEALAGLPHYMANLDCQPADYLQIFNNIDPGLITLTTALSKFQPFTLGASNSTATAAAYGAFGMDADCMARCGSTPQLACSMAAFQASKCAACLLVTTSSAVIDATIMTALAPPSRS